MTLDQLFRVIRPLKWSHESETGFIRCADGYCPLLAAYYQKFPLSAATRTNPYAIALGNSDFDKAAYALKLPLPTARAIVNAADQSFDDLAQSKRVRAIRVRLERLTIRRKKRVSHG